MEEQESYSFFVGIDWATEKHDVTVIDRQRKKVAERVFENSYEGLGAMLEVLRNLAPERTDTIAIAIEIPHGPIVELLVDHGFHVYAVNPKQLDRFRDRHTTVGAKDDRLDAFVLADSVRTDLACFRRVKLADGDMIQLRALSRIYDDLKTKEVALSNQLREQIMRYAPHLLKLCPAAQSVWFWDLLDMVANPADAVTVKRYKVEKLLKKYRLRKFTCEDVMENIKSLFLKVAPGVVEAALIHIKLILAQLRLVNEQWKTVEGQTKGIIEKLMQPAKTGEHRDAAILLSLPGVGNVVAATMLSEASQALNERDYETVRAQAGVAPVTRKSGKRCTVGMRHACSRRLRNAVYHWSRVSVQRDPISHYKYKSLRAKGHSHGRALRSIADGLLRILFGMLKSGTLFDISKRQRTA